MHRKSWLLVGVSALVVACGGGKPVAIEEEAPGGVIIVRASAGSPLEGVNATVYAIDPVTGEPIEGRLGGAVLAEAKGSSADGTLKLELGEDVTWRGPIQVVISGADILYVDPTGVDDETLVFLPDAFRLSSYVSEYRTGSTVTVPVTLWTSLADAAAKAYAAGKTAGSASPAPIERAFPVIDEVFTQHLSRPLSWNLRATVPVNVRANVGSVRDVIFAALADVALNQLARDISVTAGHRPGAVITAYQLLELLQADISDGLFDGFEGGKQLAARGGVYVLSSRTTRFDLARALGAFVDAPSNATGLTRQSLETYSVFDNIALDRNFLYPADEDPESFDAVPPEVRLLEALPEYISTRTLAVRVSAEDDAVGVAHVWALVQNGPNQKLLAAERVDEHWVLDLPLWVGANSIRIWAEDEAVPANSGEGWSPPYNILAEVIVDQAAPTLSAVSRESHRNEDAAGLVLSGGKPVVPGRLALDGRALVDIGKATPDTIKKTYVTSSWGALDPTDEDFAFALDLEGANPFNLPFRQFEVGFGGNDSEAPIQPVRWRFEASDGVTTQESEGVAVVAARKESNKLFFNVVFSRETIPLLGTTKAREVQLKLSLTVSDAAGNSRTYDGFENAYVFVDTPLHYVVDAGYPDDTLPSPKSLYGYLANQQAYSGLFGSSSPVVEAGAARVGRVEVFNPWSIPVAVAQSSSSAYFRFGEEWDSDIATAHTTDFTMDGFTFKARELWAAGVTGRPPGQFSCLYDYDSPCGVGDWRSSAHLRHDIADESTRLTCGAGAAPPLSAFTVTARLLHSAASYVVAESASPEEMAERVGDNNLAVVEAATRGAPGRVVVFPGLNADPFRRRVWNSTWTKVGNGYRYQEFAGVFYADLGTAVSNCDDGMGNRERGLVRYEARVWNRDLMSATSAFSGNLEFQAWPVYTNGATRVEVGPTPAVTLVPFSVDFTHGVVSN